MLGRILAITAIALSAATTAGAATVSRTFDGRVTGFSGAQLSSGVAGGLSVGSPVQIDVFLDIEDPFASIFEGGSVVSVRFLQNGANALIQPCCLSGEDDDPGDGTVGVSGGLGGFTGPGILDYFLSASDFGLVFSSGALPFPASFATAADAAAFLNDPSIVVSGFVTANYFANGSEPVFGEVFPQRIFFDSSVPAVPLPAGLWLLMTGMLAFAAARRRRA